VIDEIDEGVYSLLSPFVVVLYGLLSNEGFLGLLVLFNYSIEANVGLNDDEVTPVGGFELIPDYIPGYLFIEAEGKILPPGYSLSLLLSHVIICALLSKFL
jgi:hypothetical protein